MEVNYCFSNLFLFNLLLKSLSTKIYFSGLDNAVMKIIIKKLLYRSNLNFSYKIGEDFILNLQILPDSKILFSLVSTEMLLLQNFIF